MYKHRYWLPLIICAALSRGTSAAFDFVNISRIVGGQPAHAFQAPFMVSLQQEGTHVCGGSILTERWILTAAHCVKHKDITILAGTPNLSIKSGAKVFNVQRVVVHCNYNYPQYANDIALIFTKEVMKYSLRIRPIPFIADFVPDGASLKLTGWGALDYNPYADFPTAPTKLQSLSFRSVPYHKCNHLWKDADGVDIGNICAFNRLGKGACHGDSGGPLVYNGNLVGVASFVMPCATGVPDVFASVGYHYDFIRTTINSCKYKSFKTIAAQKLKRLQNYQKKKQMENKDRKAKRTSTKNLVRRRHRQRH
ncbi:chymotrypsin-1-like [Scaptodrosophila lebanonensis]|uniref:Chymotrypsin-1-like n=1 Tax=Drosophila lebanonensis TaxID=7225 RepID=A0A6J2TI76_DROLE|nr:chymotrypsin-1-like [Scaptodrosophila lebanonensis]